MGQLGTGHFFMTMDLTKGYQLILLSQELLQS